MTALEVKVLLISCTVGAQKASVERAISTEFISTTDFQLCLSAASLIKNKTQKVKFVYVKHVKKDVDCDGRPQ